MNVNAHEKHVVHSNFFLQRDPSASAVSYWWERQQYRAFALRRSRITTPSWACPARIQPDACTFARACAHAYLRSVRAL